MNIWPVEPEFFRKVAIMCLMAALSLPVQAGVEGEWQVVGVLNVIARIKGKSVTTTDRDQGPYRVVFKPEGMAFRMLDSKTSLLTGEWMQQARRFCVKLDRTSVNDFVAAIEKVEQARSGLAVAMTPLKTTLTGTRKPDGSIEGTLKIQAKAVFPAFGSAAAKMSLNYRFTGSMGKPAP